MVKSANMYPVGHIVQKNKLNQDFMLIDEAEIMSKVCIVKTYTHQFPSHISKIRSKTVGDIDMADVVFSTAHKAKGLECNTIKLIALLPLRGVYPTVSTSGYLDHPTHLSMQ